MNTTIDIFFHLTSLCGDIPEGARGTVVERKGSIYASTKRLEYLNIKLIYLKYLPQSAGSAMYSTVGSEQLMSILASMQGTLSPRKFLQALTFSSASMSKSNIFKDFRPIKRTGWALYVWRSIIIG